MITPEIFDMSELLETLLETKDFATKWRRDAQILPYYMPRAFGPLSSQMCVVRHGDFFLRHSLGPRQHHFWDTIPDDYLKPSLALLALMEASPPPSVFKPRKIFAVSQTELGEWGCPTCGYRSGRISIEGGRSAMWQCGECEDTHCVLADGVRKSLISFGSEYPELAGHPRRGTPSHGRPDKRPPGGGEYFRCRPIGMDSSAGCFVCGEGNSIQANIAAFVNTKEAGERAVALFKGRARLDYREFEPDHVQVKVGACQDHRKALDLLAVETSDSILTSEKIECVVSAMAVYRQMAPSHNTEEVR